MVSGRTVYEGKTFLERACGVLRRAYVESRTLRTEHISNNNAGFRREVLRKRPLPSEAGPFSSKLHADAIQRDGWQLLFDDRASATHAFDGWEMERDIRQNMGYGFIKVRQINPELPFGGWCNSATPRSRSTLSLASLRAGCAAPGSTAAMGCNGTSFRVCLVSSSACMSWKSRG